MTSDDLIKFIELNFCYPLSEKSINAIVEFWDDVDEWVSEKVWNAICDDRSDW